MKSKIEAKQYLRYMKTFLWANKKTLEELMEVSSKGIMVDYPVDATNLEDAINFIETGDGLRETKISKTDLYAMMESMKHKNKN